MYMSMFFVTGTTVETSDLQNTTRTGKTTSALQFFCHILFLETELLLCNFSPITGTQMVWLSDVLLPF